MSEQFYRLSTPVSAEEFTHYFQFRWQQLRQPLNLPSGSEQDSLELQAHHCMAVTEDHTIIGVGRVHLDTSISAQVRFMAIHSNFQRRQIGSQILVNLLSYAKSAGAKSCWLNARASACKFYQSHGFMIIDEVDSSLNVPHFRMEKKLN